MVVGTVLFIVSIGIVYFLTQIPDTESFGPHSIQNSHERRQTTTTSVSCDNMHKKIEDLSVKIDNIQKIIGIIAISNTKILSFMNPEK